MKNHSKWAGASIVLAVAVGVVAYAQTYSGGIMPAPNPDIGRFCLFQGHYAVVDEASGGWKADSSYVKGLFKLDTATGEVWEYVVRYQADQFNNNLHEIREWTRLENAAYVYRD